MYEDQHISALTKLTNLYNPENDVATPRVSSTEMALIIIINDLIESISDLETKVSELDSYTIADDY